MVKIKNKIDINDNDVNNILFNILFVSIKIPSRENNKE